MKHRMIVALFILALSAVELYAQSVKITGLVVSKTDGEGLIGATVREVGTEQAALTDLDGNFVREFNTTAECNRYFLPDASGGGHVPRAIRLGHLFHGYQLSYEKVPFMKKF